MIKVSRHTHQKICRLLRADSGAALVEFALLLPLTLVTFALIAEGGRLFWSYQNVITGVRDTARHLGRVAPPRAMCEAGGGASISDYETFVTDKLTALSTDKIDVDLDQLNRTCIAGDFRGSPVTVATVSASLTITELPFAPLFGLFLDTELTQIEATVADSSRVYGP